MKNWSFARKPVHTACVRLGFAIICLAVLAEPALQARSAIQGQQGTPPVTAARPGEARFRVLRSVAGSKVVSEGNSTSVVDPRADFYVPDDKQVIVYFNWSGPLGQHHFEGMWKNPEGKVVVVSEYSYRVETQTFGGYFSMLMSDSISTGIWTLEATIDGENAGSHHFTVIAAPRPETVNVTRRILNRSEFYSRLVSATVFIENLNDKGDRNRTASGFLIGPGKILTAFDVIDGASKLRIRLPDGKRLETDEIIAANRLEDWAVVKIAADVPGGLDLIPAGNTKPGEWVVGDRCFSADSPSQGNRVLTETSIAGKRQLTRGGERIIIGEKLSPSAIGAPLLNEFGEVIGLVGGGLTPGTALPDDMPIVEDLAAAGLDVRGTLAVPISLLSKITTSDPPKTLHDLAAAGQFTTPLSGYKNIYNGSLSRDIDTKNSMPMPIDRTLEFTRRDHEAAVIVGWSVSQKRKITPSIRVFDTDNKLIGEIVAQKPISVNANVAAYSTFRFDLTKLSPGVYRLDVMLNSEPVWRRFFEILE